MVDRQNEAMMLPIVRKHMRHVAKHKQWTESRDDRWFGEIQKQGKTLDEEIDRAHQTVFAMRAHVLTSLTEDKTVPEGMSEQVANAETAVELLRLSLKSTDVIADDALPEEAVTAIRGPLNSFYFAVADFADEKYAEEWQRWSDDQQMADAFEKKRPQDQCQRNLCHTSGDNNKWMITQGLRYQEPQSSEPYVSQLQPPVDKAAKVADWEGVVKDYRKGARILDRLLLSSFRMSNEEDRQVYDTYQYAMEQGDRLEGLREKSSTARRIRAVYYPKDTLVTDPEDSTKQLQIANGIHWQFYLTIEGNEWVLQDFTAPSPRGPFRYAATQEDIDSFADPDPNKLRDPPTALFDQMNNAKIFPYGHLY